MGLLMQKTLVALLCFFCCKAVANSDLSFDAAKAQLEGNLFTLDEERHWRTFYFSNLAYMVRANQPLQKGDLIRSWYSQFNQTHVFNGNWVVQPVTRLETIHNSKFAKEVKWVSQMGNIALVMPSVHWEDQLDWYQSFVKEFPKLRVKPDFNN